MADLGTNSMPYSGLKYSSAELMAIGEISAVNTSQ